MSKIYVKRADGTRTTKVKGAFVSEKGLTVRDELVATATGVDNADGTGTLTVQIEDNDGLDVTGKFLFTIIFAAVADTVGSDLGEVAATTGVIMAEPIADIMIVVATDATGTAVLTLTAVDQWFYNIDFRGNAMVEGSIVVTDP